MTLFSLVFTDGWAQKVDSPKLNDKEVSILYYQGSYIPSKLTVFEGENLVVHFGNFSGTPQCLWSKDLDFFTSSYQGRVTSSVLKSLKAGNYTLSCPNEKEVQQVVELTVLSKFMAKDNEKIDRTPSSVGKTEWVPRDEKNDYLQTSLNTNGTSKKLRDSFKREYNFEMIDQGDDYENYFERGY